MINQPAPARIAIGHAMVKGERVEVIVSLEWSRYFESLTSQTNLSASIGDTGSIGAAGASIGFLESGIGNDVEFVPGPRGEDGVIGPPGPAIFLLEDPVENDIFWRV